MSVLKDFKNSKVKKNNKKTKQESIFVCCKKKKEEKKRITRHALSTRIRLCVMFDNVPSALKEEETESRRRLRACLIDATYKRTHTQAHAYERIKTLKQSLAYFERIPSNIQHTKPVHSYTYANTEHCAKFYI